MAEQKLIDIDGLRTFRTKVVDAINEKVKDCVSSENTEEVAASVEEAIMEQYGTSIAQLRLELSEIKARIAALEGK